MKVEIRDIEDNLIIQNLFNSVRIPSVGNIINHIEKDKPDPIKFIVVNIEYNTRNYKPTSVRMVADYAKLADCIVRVKAIETEEYEDYDFKGRCTIA